MSITGAGPGGTPGGPIHISHRDQEATASTANAMAAMHIVKDTLLIPLILVDTDARKYQSSSNRPVLAPLSTNRGAASFAPPADQSWKAVYQELLTLLPPEFKALFESAMLLPADQRNSNINNADTTLQMASNLLNILRNAGIPLDPESLEGLRAADNIAQPFIALNAMTYVFQELQSGAQSYLEMVGPNDPNFDAISGAVGTLTSINTDLKSATELLTDSSTEADGKALLTSVQGEIATLSAQFDRIGAGGDFQLMGNALHAADLATSALLLENLGSAALLIGLTNATYGLNNDSSDLAVTGSNFSAVSQSIADGIKSHFLDKSNAGQEKLFQTLLDSALVLTLLLGTLAYDSKAQTQTQKEISDNVREVSDRNKEVSNKEVSENNYTQELRIAFLAGSGMLSEIGNLIAKEAGASPSKLASMSSLIVVGLILMLVGPSIRGGDLASAGPLLNGVSDQLQSSLAIGMHGSKGGGGGGGGDDELALALEQDLKVYLQQAEIALEDKNTDALLYSIHKFLDNVTADTQKFIDDVNDLKNTAHTTSDNLTISANSAATTNITQAA